MTDPGLTISIAVHDQIETTKKCLSSLFEFTKNFKLVITDNASTDGTSEYLAGISARGGESVEVVRNEKNLGFIQPHNAAFARSTTPLFCVLNNDLELSKGWAERMIEALLEDPKIAGVGLRNTCVALDDKGNGMPSNDVVEYLEGSCVIYRAAAIQSLPGGLFDPVFKFGYYEDSDLCLRLAQAGWLLATVDLPIKHLGGVTARAVRTKVDLEGYKIRNQSIFIGRWGSYLKNRRRRPVSKDRIVVRRGGARGDVILSTGLVRELRRQYPKSAIVVSTHCPDVYIGNPNVTEVLLMAPVRDGDLLIDLDMAYEKRPFMHLIEAYAEQAQIELPPEKWQPELYPTDTARIVSFQRMPQGPKYAIIHPGMIPGWAGRQWLWRNFIQVAAELRKKGYKIVLVGTEETPGITPDIDCRNIPFVHMAALMERASLFVGLDSMPLHVAQAFKVPSVAIFGSVDPALRLVPGLPAVGVTAEGVGCLGCHHWLPAPRTSTATCARGAFGDGVERCMSEIKVPQVLEAVEKVERMVAPVVS